MAKPILSLMRACPTYEHQVPISGKPEIGALNPSYDVIAFVGRRRGLAVDAVGALT